MKIRFSLNDESLYAPNACRQRPSKAGNEYDGEGLRSPTSFNSVGRSFNSVQLFPSNKRRHIKFKPNDCLINGRHWESWLAFGVWPDTSISPRWHFWDMLMQFNHQVDFCKSRCTAFTRQTQERYPEATPHVLRGILKWPPLPTPPKDGGNAT